MCRMMAGRRPSYLLEFVRISKRDSRGLSHGDGWGYAVYDGRSVRVTKKLDPIWESFEALPRFPFVLHARRAKKLPKSLDHVHPHVCNGVVLAHNGNAAMPLPSGMNLARRTVSERIACYLGRLLRSMSVEEALSTFVRTVKPKPSANFVALVPWLNKLIVMNYHNGDEYYVMWKKGDLFSSEPLGSGWEPLSLTGKPVWEVLDLTSSLP